ncbi:hypothetical protein KDK95_30855, partial [Actinospica sp. MGRD01-02]|nr:hypothetical protein [Actinospica acidithermotolerans]
MTFAKIEDQVGMERGQEPPPGVLGRIGLVAARRFRTTVLLWLVLVAGLGALAPQVTSVLAGAGWQASGSQSVQVRDLVDRHFGGTGSTAIQVVVHADGSVADPAARAVLAKATGLLQANRSVAEVIQPRPGLTVSADGHT